MRIGNFLFSVLLVSVTILSLGSCKLASTKPNTPVYTEDYDKSSPLYGKSVTGVAVSSVSPSLIVSSEDTAQKTFVTTNEGDLWERDLKKGNWSKINSKLPKAYNKVMYILDASGSQGRLGARLVLVNDTTNVVGIGQLNYADDIITQVLTAQANQKVRTLVRNSFANSNAYLVTVDVSSTSGTAPMYLHVYNFNSGNGSEIPLLGKDKKNPSAKDEILGCLKDRSAFLVKINGEQGVVYELRGAGFENPITVTCPAGKQIKLLDCANVQGKCNPVVIMTNNDIHPIDPVTGKINEKICIKGLDGQLIANGMGRLDKTYVLTTNKGYYEISSNDTLRQPSDETTDTLSYYKQNALNKAHISGIYNIGDRVYLSTYGRGLWVRDPQTKKWKGV